MKRKEWKFSTFSIEKNGRKTATDIVIDDRFVTGEQLTLEDGRLTNYKTGESWAPLCILPISERFPASETQEYARIICQRLNNLWIEETLKDD